jgi:hypothetical protein
MFRMLFAAAESIMGHPSHRAAPQRMVLDLSGCRLLCFCPRGYRPRQVAGADDRYSYLSKPDAQERHEALSK